MGVSDCIERVDKAWPELKLMQAESECGMDDNSGEYASFYRRHSSSLAGQPVVSGGDMESLRNVTVLDSALFKCCFMVSAMMESNDLTLEKPIILH